jgi:hypothetical protein
MATFSTVTVNGTQRPWNFDAIAAASGTPGAHLGYNVNFTDGTAAGGSAGQNTSYAYGGHHTTAGETAPTTVAVTPGSLVTLVYEAGTVNSGSTSFGPHGDNTSPPLFPTADYGDPAGLCYPTDCMPAAKSLNGANPVIGRGGLCGCFTDGSGNVIANSFWNWLPVGVIYPNAGFPTNQITSVVASSGSTAVYNGVFTLGGSNFFAGQFVYITGFTNAVNNGLFFCTTSTTGSLTLTNPNAIAETKNVSVVIGAAMMLIVPPGASFISIGIDDTQLFDNTGSFTMGVWVMQDADLQGDTSYPTRYPYGISQSGLLADAIGGGYKAWFVPFIGPPTDTGLNGFMKAYVGQLWPHGAQNYGGAPAGSNGQNFNY